MKVLLRSIFYWSCWSTLRLTFSIYFRLRATGVEHVPLRGGVVIAANHASYLDPLFAGLPVRRQLSFMARESLFRHVFGTILRALGSVPIRRGRMTKTSLREVLARLTEKGGGGLMVFPEGTRSVSQDMGKLREGAVRIAQMAQVQIVPCFIEGNHRAWGRGSIFPRPTRVRVAFGAPFDPTGDVSEVLALLRDRLLELEQGMLVQASTGAVDGPTVTPVEDPGEPKPGAP